MFPGLEWTVTDRRSSYAAHVGAAAKLFETTFQRDFPQAAWEQYYLENPYGDPVVSLAYSGSTLVAHQALIPGTATDGAAEVRYYLSMSTMVHPAHRSMPVLIRLFDSIHRQASGLGGAFVLGFPNANLQQPLRRCFGYTTLVESSLRNWVPPYAGTATVLPDSAVNQLRGCFSPPCTVEYWSWRTRLNRARSVTVNGRLRVVYKLLTDGTLNVLNVQVADDQPAWLDLAGLAAAEECRNIRITDYHASVVGIPGEQLTSHEDYRLRMTARALNQAVPNCQFNLLFCDIF